MEAPKQTPPTPTPVEDNLFKIKGYVRKFWADALDLEHGVDKRLTINEIKDKKSMSGPNAWMLMCSIVIASVGLDMNSPAVIIGGMLISPLMSPILGMGLAVGINDKETLKKSLAHFGMAVFIALVTSTLYFMLTPLGQVTPEISARTEPGPLDIFIAFFGGIAGIVSIARKDISTTLPGVAIATALMPPVCVAGFGIANGNLDIALSSFFLFFINTVFVSFATYIIVRFVLHFPQRDFANALEKKKNSYYIAAFLISIAAISFFPFKKLLNKRSMDHKVQTFVDTVFGDEIDYYDGNEFYSRGDSNLLLLKVYGDGEQFMKEDGYQSLLEDIGLKNTKVEILPTATISKDDLLALDNKIKGMQDLNGQLKLINDQKSASEEIISKLKAELSTFKMDTTNLSILSNVIQGVSVDNIEGISYGKGQSNDFGSIRNDFPLIIVDWKEMPKDHEKYERQIYHISKSQLNVDTVRVAHLYN